MASGRRVKSMEEWPRVLEDAVRQVLARNRGGQEYGVRVPGCSDGGTKFELEVTFRSGRTYCCSEIGCHLGSYERDWWRRLREEIALVSDRELPAMTISAIHVVVEKGAVFSDHPEYGEQAVAGDTRTYRAGPDREVDAK